MKSRSSREKSRIRAYSRKEASLLRQDMSSSLPLSSVEMWYRIRTRLIPETIAENRKTIGIRTLLHQGFALMEPKMKQTYPCRRNADGMPMRVMACTALLSNFREPG